MWVSRLCHVKISFFLGQSFLRTGISKSYNTATRPEKQGIEFNGDMFAECVLLAIAVCVNLALFVATIKGIPLLFMPWMLFYGFEVLAGWAITLAFLILPGTLPNKMACRHFFLMYLPLLKNSLHLVIATNPFYPDTFTPYNCDKSISS